MGVVADTRNDGLRNAIKPAVYVPYSLRMRMFTQILVRTRVAPLSLLRAARAEIVQIDREQQVMQVRDLEGWITEPSRIRAAATGSDAVRDLFDSGPGAWGRQGSIASSRTVWRRGRMNSGFGWH